MNIEIRAPGGEVPAALAEHITTRFSTAVGVQRDQLERILVRIGDSEDAARRVNCHVVARLRGRTLVVHDGGGDAEEAASRSAARLAELIVAVSDRYRPIRSRSLVAGPGR